ncbi:hypothetical protein LHJ74_11160 [Streptomyces sp. N2-109]|uniref:Uncharacterized protein n=1 Tax=Streptomyces gossypii TaxID=2883101 RepID=A0ABT2JRE0_9ACTN|nr:hypothetical protein [Streptomyces gossypii]MCT2590462.1 hypothetical protein [Streptomyces gossypii]
MSYQDPPPGPYGAGPPQPGQHGPTGPTGPYDATPPPHPPAANPHAQPGYGYPQQQAYGYPQQSPGYPQQPGQPSPPYGMPYPPQPAPGGGGNGRTIGIIVGALALAGAIIGGAVAFTGGGDEDGEVAAYKIVPPHSVLDGKYTKADTPGGGDGTVQDSDAKKLGVENGSSVSASYRATSEGDLRLAGVHGEIADPQESADAMFALVHKSQDDLGDSIENYEVETVSEREEYSPEGFDGSVLACETQRQSGEVYGRSLDVEFSTCVWADGSAVAVVSQSGAQSSSGTFGESMPKDELAEATVKVREETRKESKEK